MINFGDVFRSGEKIYVYLVQTEDLILAARIHDKDTTKQLIASRDKNSRNPNKRTDEQTLYCFVVLSTEGFNDQAAHYGNPILSNKISLEPIKRLCDEDIERLKKEIKDDSAVSPLLKNTITTLFPTL